MSVPDPEQHLSLFTLVVESKKYLYLFIDVIVWWKLIEENFWSALERP